MVEKHHHTPYAEFQQIKIAAENIKQTFYKCRAWNERFKPHLCKNFHTPIEST